GHVITTLFLYTTLFRSAGHDDLNVVDQVVDNRIVTDLYASPLSQVARFLRRADVKADHRRARAFGELDVRLVDRADAREHHARAHFFVRQLVERADNGFR